MDPNSVSSNRTQKTNAATPAAKSQSVSPTDLLKGLVGAPTQAVSGLEQIQSSIARLSSITASVQSAAVVETPPALPAKESTSVSRTLPPSGPSDRLSQTDLLEMRILVDDPANKTTRSGREFRASRDASAIFEAGEGRVGTQEKVLRDYLWDRTPEQLRAVELTYKDRYGREMFQELNSEFDNSKYDREFVKRLKDGDRVGAASMAILEASFSGSKDTDRIKSVLNRLSAEELQQLKEQFPKDSPKGQSLEKVLFPPLPEKTRNPHMKAHDSELVVLYNGDKDGARLIGVTDDLGRKKGGEVVETLRGLDQDQMAALRKGLEGKAPKGTDLDGYIASKLPAGPDRDQVTALLKGDKLGADAARLRDAVDGNIINRDDLFDSLSSDIKDPAERKKYMTDLEAEYNKNYGPGSNGKGKTLREQIARMGGEDREKATSLLKYHGQLPPEKKLQYALGGWDVDGTEIPQLVEQLGGPDKARAAYARVTATDKKPKGLDLDKKVKSELGGRSLFEAQLALEKPPETPAEKAAVARRRAEFEAPEATVLGVVANPLAAGAKGAGRMTTDTDNIMWENVRRSEYAVEQYEKAEKAGNTQLAAHWERRVDELTGYAKDDTEVYRGEKDGLADGASMAALMAAGVVVSVGTGGSAAPAIGAALARQMAVRAVIGGAANVATRETIQGQAYDGKNQAGKDFLVGAVELAPGAIVDKFVDATKVGQAISKPLGKVTTNAVLEGATTGAAVDGTQAFLDGEDIDKIVERARNGGVVGAAFGALTGKPLEWASEKLLKGVSPQLRNSDSVGAPSTPDGKTGPVRTQTTFPELKSEPGSTLSYDRAGVATKVKEVYAKEEPSLKKIQAERKEKMDKIDQELEETKPSPERVKELGEQRRKILEVHPDEDWLAFSQANVFREEAKSVIAEAKKSGRLDSTVDSDILLEHAVALRLYKDFQATSSLDPALTQGAVKKLTRGVYQVDSKTTPGLVEASLEMQTQRYNLKANRAAEPSPPTLETSAGQVKVYGAKARDADIARTALGRVEEMAPNILTDVKEIHYETLISSKTRRTPDAPAGESRSKKVSDVKGYMVTNSGADFVVVKEGGTYNSDAKWRKVQADKAVSDAHSNKEFNEFMLQKSISEAEVLSQSPQFKDLFAPKLDEWRAELEKVRAQAVDPEKVRKAAYEELQGKTRPAYDLPENEQSHTIAHETGHNFDERSGWISHTDKAGPQGEGQIFSDQPGVPTDFVTRYPTQIDAVGKPKLRREEDFADTVGFLVNFPYLKEKPPLGPLTEVAVKKLEGVAGAIGYPPDELTKLIDYYGRAQ